MWFWAPPLYFRVDSNFPLSLFLSNHSCCKYWFQATGKQLPLLTPLCFPFSSPLPKVPTLLKETVGRWSLLWQWSAELSHSDFYKQGYNQRYNLLVLHPACIQEALFLDVATETFNSSTRHMCPVEATGRLLERSLQFGKVFCCCRTKCV